MNKYIKMTAGSLLAAALMVGCNVNDGMPDNDNESMMDNPVNDNRDNNAMDGNNGDNNNAMDGNNRADDDWGMDGDRNNDRNTDTDKDPMRDENANGEDIIEDDIDREDRDNRDE
ncbi:hypothetical protein [Jeotgalibacillus terrae]|uniref:Lipoprotein n=1 Tax=Jeotgalibacillus terrae TaxID=587735 RepID=A0ABW5ZD73_9BACL|nr:hypothetical protein [Jeotgalibacillus terrae]MBM7577919.1 hypothetical protein [Jeotgalibacillus terrae]